VVNYCTEERWVSNPDEFQVATNPMTIKIRVYEPTREFRDEGAMDMIKAA